MNSDGAYGRNLGDYLRVSDAQSFVTRTLRPSKIAVTQITCNIENNGPSAPIPKEEAFLVTLQIRDCLRHDLWLEGKPVPTTVLAAGTTSIYDLRQDPMVNSVSPFRNMHFYFPRSALEAVAEQEGISSLESPPHNPGVGIDDPVIRGLGLSLLPAFERPDEANPLFVDHVTTAAAAYVARLFGAAVRLIPGALSKAQEQRAKEILSANLDGVVSVTHLAKECGLAPRAFSNAFRRSTGQFPHQWLLHYRIERAKHMLRRSKAAIADIALATGFGNEDHFVRIFSRVVGMAPETWRSQKT